MQRTRKLVRITTVPVSLEKLLENQLSFMSGYFEVIAVSSDKERLSKYGADNNIKTKHIELTRKITPVQDVKSLWQLYTFLKKEKPDIVHTHTPKAGIVGMLAAKLAGVPVRMHTVAGLPLLETRGMKRIILNLVEKLTYYCATNVYPNSFGLKKIILDLNFLPENKCKVIANGSSNGIDTDYFNPNAVTEPEKHSLRKKLAIEKDDFVFVFVGRLVGDKGINELVTAFNRLNENLHHIKLLLVGPLESELDPLEKSTISKINTNNNIISVGYQEDIRPYLAISDVLTFPSYREGLPNVVLQAGAMGLPAIVTDINGCNEIITNGENGMIIPVKSVERLREAMESLLNNEQLRQSLKEKARPLIERKYKQETLWKALLEEYKRFFTDEN